MTLNTRDNWVANLKAEIEKFGRAGNVDAKPVFAILRCADPNLATRLMRFPNAQLLHQALELESSTDFSAAGSERERVMDEIGQIAEKEDLVNLVKTALDFKMNKITPAAFHALLVSMAEIYQVTDRYPSLTAYAKYTEIMETIDFNRVLTEIKSLCHEVIRDLEKPISNVLPSNVPKKRWWQFWK